jgi:hypothetical protein
MDRDDLPQQGNEEELHRRAEQRRFVYKDLEEVLVNGYLSHSLSHKGVHVQLRTLRPKETSSLISRIEMSKGDDWKRWYLSSSLSMINGYEIEPSANSPWYVYQEWTKEIDKESLEIMCYTLHGLRYRAERVMRLVEAFSYESYSRFMWKIRKEQMRSLEDPTPAQQIWKMYNDIEDNLKEDSKTWIHTKAIIGSMSGKAAKSISQSEEKFMEERKKNSEKVIEDTVNAVLFGEKPTEEPVYVEINGQKVLMPKVKTSSIEEMEEDMARVMRGEKDYHDLVVEDYKNKVRAKMAAIQIEREETRKRAMKIIEEEQTRDGGDQVVGYTKEQLKELGKSQDFNTTTGSVISDEDRAFREYINNEVRIGWIGLSGVPEEANLSKTQSSKKEMYEPMSLQDKITKRIPTLK